MYHLALDMIAAQFEHIYEDNNKSDDLTGDVNNDKSSTSDSENEELHTGTEKNDVPDISYKAEFYEYIGRIAITRANVTRNEDDEDHEDNLIDITSMYAIPKGLDTAHDRTLLSAGILAELGTYITIRSKVLQESLEDIARYYPMVPFDKEELVLHEPFCILLHYRRELAERLGALERAVRENEDYDSVELEHLTYVVDFVQQRYAGELLQEEMHRQESQAMCTFEWS
ncbi:hypothetical protein G7Y79_00060g092290 [Physcia stellaris]|nr:hypothetical protein G7Y79_00060g092290 [Physcia stellaris]